MVHKSKLAAIPTYDPLPVMVIAQSGISFKSGIKAFEKLGYDVETSNSLDFVLERLIEDPQCWTLLVLRIDFSQKMTQLISFAKSVRIVNPQLPLLFVSPISSKKLSNVASTAICDGIVCEPLSSGKLYNAIEDSVRNNCAFLHRQDRRALLAHVQSAHHPILLGTLPNLVRKYLPHRPYSFSLRERDTSR